MALHTKLDTESVYMSETDYLTSELSSEVKREYIDGRVYAMGGASNNHSRISANVLRDFGNHLKGKPCEAFAADTKVKAGQNYFYPDVVVDCSQPSGDDYFTKAPVIIVEVLSKSTKKHDLTTKLVQYINLPSLQEYVLIEQDCVEVQILRRRNHWQSEYYFLGDSVTFDPIGLTLSVEAIYDRVDNSDMNEYRQPQPEV
ncbi:Uma2 family endonuclease [Crenothrix sp.]|uniref:Uma2 family endonuclease n=1 Tax=Crenothrix sp. TaxID=3100433 RepID=UPI00374CE749